MNTTSKELTNRLLIAIVGENQPFHNVSEKENTDKFQSGMEGGILGLTVIKGYNFGGWFGKE